MRSTLKVLEKWKGKPAGINPCAMPDEVQKALSKISCGSGYTAPHTCHEQGDDAVKARADPALQRHILWGFKEFSGFTHRPEEVLEIKFARCPNINQDF